MLDETLQQPARQTINSFDPIALGQISQQSLQSELDLSSFVVEVKRAILQTNSDRASAKNAISTDIYKAEGTTPLRYFTVFHRAYRRGGRIFTMK